MAPRQRAQPGQGREYVMPSGRIGIAIQLGGRRYHVSGATRTEARRKRDALVARHRAGTLGDPLAGHTRFDVYLRDWLGSKRPSIKESSWLRYRAAVETYAVPLLGAHRLASLTAPDIRRYYATLTQRGLGPASLQMQRAVLRQAFQQAVDDGLLARNPAVGVKTPRRPRQEMLVLSGEEVARLLDAAPNGLSRTLWTLAAYTGLREGELLGLLWRDVEPLEQGVVRVQRSLVDVAQGLPRIQDEPKESASIRRVRIPPEVVALLRAHRQEQRLARLAAGKGWLDRRGLVFATETGLPLRRQAVGRALTEAARVAGVARRVHMHGFRHAYASHLLAQGRPLPEVSRLLGHATTQTTSRIYAHAIPEERGEAAAEAISRAYFRA